MKEKRTFWVNLDGDGVCQFKPENVEGLSDTWVEVEDIKKYEPKKNNIKTPPIIINLFIVKSILS